MGALSQYLELYNANRQAIEQGSCAIMNSMRSVALQALAGKELPDTHTPGYEKTSIDEMFAPDYGMNINRLPLPCDVAGAFKCGVPNVSSLLAIVVNDRFTPTSTLLNNLPAGVKVMSLAGACEEYPDEVAKYYGKVADINDPGTALNTLLAQDGIYVHVDRDVVVERPLQIVTLTSTPVPMLTARRLLIVTEPGAKISILTCDHSMQGNVQALTSQVVEVVAAEGAYIDLCDLEETNDSQSRFNQVYVNQGDNTNVALGGMILCNGSTRNEYRVRVNGSGSTTRISGLAIGTASQHIDNSSDVCHNAPHSTSNQLFKYVLDDRAHGAFEGSIEVTPNAPYTEAYQSDRNILASPQARMHTKPQLLIYNDEVKCSHGATTGQLDEKALFYMQSRGIPRAEARMLLMQAFMTEVIEDVRIEVLRDRLRHLVERRLSGHNAHCSDCKI